jgi:NAD(P)-dependent dehydrogenase (short-subunit alcohol dehydrogenase family)
MGLPEPPALGAHALPTGTYDGRTVIVTGGGTGLGKAIAVEFARVGAKIAILSRSEEHRAAGLAAVEAVGAKALSVGCDIRDPDAIRQAFDTVTSELGLADVLVNNAAGNFPVPAEDMSPNAWRTVTDIVLNGTFYCSREFGRRHIEASTPGSIINIGAAYAWTGGPGFAHSSAAKAGVKNMTETLAVEWGPYGIRVNGLVPGLFPHDDETANIRSVPDRRRSEALRCPGTPRTRLGRDFSRLAFRKLHLGAHPGCRWSELAAARDADARVRANPRTVGQGILRSQSAQEDGLAEALPGPSIDSPSQQRTSGAHR